MKSTHQLATSFLRTLTPEQRAYAVAAERGEFRGFAALQDLFDANECLAELSQVRQFDSGEESIAYFNAAIAEINASLLA